MYYKPHSVYAQCIWEYYIVYSLPLFYVIWLAALPSPNNIFPVSSHSEPSDAFAFLYTLQMYRFGFTFVIIRTQNIPHIYCLYVYSRILLFPFLSD